MAINGMQFDLVDRDGLSTGAIFNAAADSVLPEPAVRVLREKPLTTEERLKRLEENKMPDPAPKKAWEDPNYWANPIQPGAAPQQQQQPQITVPTQEQQQQMGKVPLPQTQQELAAIIRSEVTQALTGVQQHAERIQQQGEALRSKFLNHPQWAPWANIAVNQFTNFIRQGMDVQAAYSATVSHVQNLAAQGVTVDPSRVPSPNYGNGAGAQGGGHSYGDASFRPDEGGMKNRIGFYSDEQRAEDREKYNLARKYDQEFAKSRGELGAPMSETYYNLRDEIIKL